MTRALLWKEWREQRVFLLAGLAAALGLPLVMGAAETYVARTEGPRFFLEGLPLAFATVLWPVLAAATGAQTLAGESGEGTLPFLLSRPVSRVGVWSVKVATALGTLVAGIAGSLLIVGVLQRLAAGGDSLLSERLFVSSPHPLGLAAGSLLLFAAAVLFSTFVDQTLTAAAGGLAVTLLVGAGLLFAAGRLSLHPLRDLHVLAGEAALLAVLLLLVSLAVFARSELLGRAARGPAWAVASGAGLTIVLLGLVPAVHLGARVPLDAARIEPGSVWQAGNTIAVTATAPDGSRSDVWLIRADGSGALRLAGPGAKVATVSTDGAMIAYLSRRGFPSWAGPPHRDLRVVWPASNGDIDRLAVPDLRSPTRVTFGPSGESRWLALQDGDELVVARLDGRRLERFDTAGTPLEGTTILSGLTDPPGLLLGRDLPDGNGHWLGSYTWLGSHTASTGEARTISSGPGRLWIPDDGSSSRSLSDDGPRVAPAWWPVIRPVDGVPGDEVALVGLHRGEELARLEGVCGIDAVAGEILLYRHCTAGAGVAPESSPLPPGAIDWELRTLGPEPGGRGTLESATEGGLPESVTGRGLLESATGRRLLPEDPRTPLWLSPGRRHALFWVGGGPGATERGVRYPAMVSAEGGRRDLPAGFRPVGWIDERRALVLRTGEAEGAPRVVEMLVADAATGTLQPLFPSGGR